jgi:DNA-binding protein Fis
LGSVGYHRLKPFSHKRLPFRHKNCLTQTGLVYKCPSKPENPLAAGMEELMNATAIQEREESEIVAQPEDQEASSWKTNLNTLKAVVLQLLCDLQRVEEVNTLSIESGFDFYEEVSRFEIDLIKRALVQTGGNQVRAARLLKLNVTTLNSKIKRHNITLTGFSNVYPLVDASKLTDRQHV